jgi:hypothetical protein
MGTCQDLVLFILCTYDKTLMISLRKLILDDMETWITDDSMMGARNKDNVVRYFTDKEKASKFARGEIPGPHPGRPQKKKRRTPKKEKQQDKLPDAKQGT